MEIESSKIKDNIKNLIHLNQSFNQESVLFLINSKRKLYIYTSSNLNDVLERVNEFEFNKSISPRDVDNIEIKNFFEIMTNSRLEDKSVNNMINQTFQSIKERNQQRKKGVVVNHEKRLFMLRQKRKGLLKKGIFNEKYQCNDNDKVNDKDGNGKSSQSNNKNINVIEYKDKYNDKDNINLNKNECNNHNNNSNDNNKYNTNQLKEIISKQNLNNNNNENEKEENKTIENKKENQNNQLNSNNHNHNHINKIGNISKMKKLHVDTNFKINDIPNLNLKKKNKPFPQVHPVNTVNTLSTIQFDNKNDNLFSEKSNFSNLINVHKENQVNNTENLKNNTKDNKKEKVNTNKDDINIFNSIDNQIKRNQIGNNLSIQKKEASIKPNTITNHKSISPRGELMSIFNNKPEVKVDNIQSELSYIDNIIDKNKNKQSNLNNIQNNNISHTKQLTESSLYVKNNNNFTNQMTTGGIFSKNSNFLFFYNNFEINDNNSDSESDYRLD